MLRYCQEFLLCAIFPLEITVIKYDTKWTKCGRGGGGEGVYRNPIIENRLKCDVASRTEYSENQ